MNCLDRRRRDLRGVPNSHPTRAVDAWPYFWGRIGLACAFTPMTLGFPLDHVPGPARDQRGGFFFPLLVDR